MSVILIRNATLINEGKSFKGDLLIKDEIISSIDLPGQVKSSPGTHIIDATGLLLLPGIIDDHVHFRDPGLTHKGDIFSESRAAAAGGITSFMDMPNTIPRTVTLSLLDEKFRLASEYSLINYSFYLGGTNNNLNEVLGADPASVCGLKLFLGSSTGDMLLNDETVLREIFKKSLLPVACHCEDELTIKKNLEFYFQKYGENIPVNLHPLIRSREACFISSSFAVSLAKEYNTRLHILHLSTADEMKLFSNELSTGQKRITAEVCPHHLWFDDSAYDSLGTKIKWNPSVKTRFDRDELVEGVKNNLIDVIGTDHAPHTLSEKSADYFKAPSGGPLVQHSLAVMLELWHQKIFSLGKIVEMMCHNPAIAFKIKKRGFLREGYIADLCLVNPDSPWTVTKGNLLYKCGWSPFEDVTFRSKVIKTFVNGTVVYDNGVINEDHRGQRLSFDR